MLSSGDVVVLGNVVFRKTEKPEQLVKAKGAWLQILPPYLPDLNHIAICFSKTQGTPAKASRSKLDAIAKALSDIINRFSVTECLYLFKAVGYKAEEI